MKHSEVKQALRILNFTEYEAKAYVCLVEKGPLTANSISELANIPHSKTYEVLTRLQRRVLIEIQKGRPMIFRAIAPVETLERLERELDASLKEEFNERKTGLERLLNQRMREVIEARKSASEELGYLYKKRASIELSEDAVWTIKGDDVLDTQAKDLIASADREVRLMLPHDDFSKIEDAVKMSFSKGVKIRLLIHELTPSVSNLSRYAEIFLEEAPFPTNCGIILVDKKKAIFIFENYETGFKTSSGSVVAVLSHFYEHEIEESKKIESFD